MGDQPAQRGVGVLGVAQVPDAIELVQAREGKAGGVADVVQLRGSFQQIGVSAENGCQAAAAPGSVFSFRRHFSVMIVLPAAVGRLAVQGGIYLKGCRAWISQGDDAASRCCRGAN
jgi:hypothetical protein